MAVLGNLDLLRKRLPDDPALQRLIDGAMQGAERGATLTKRMLAFARRQELKPEAVDVAHSSTAWRRCCAARSGPRIEITIAVRARSAADPRRSQPARAGAAQPRRSMPATRCRTAARLHIAARSRAVGAGDVAGLDAGDYVCIAVTRHRRRHGRGDAEARDRAVLHHQGRRARAPGSACRWSMASPRNRAASPACSSRSASARRVELWLPVANGAADAVRQLAARRRDRAEAERSLASSRSMTTRWSPRRPRRMLEDLGHRGRGRVIGPARARAHPPGAGDRSRHHRPGDAAA